ncbi:hypothetical protein RintRC_4036 [Richelia intracellularis]|nr:hypothetical protein RintRC_4036 [Richelia intracellularis]
MPVPASTIFLTSLTVSKILLPLSTQSPNNAALRPSGYL